MCQFLSGIVLKNGDVITSEYTDSHDLIVEAAGLQERRIPLDMGWVKVEYTSDNLLDINTYELHVDETDTPDWLDNAMRENVSAKMHRIAQKCILLDGEIPILLGGKWVIGGEAKIQKAVNSLIVQMNGGTLNTMNGGTLNDMWGGTLNDMWGGTLNTMWGGTLNTMNGGTLNDMRGGMLNAMWGGTLNDMWGGTLNDMRGGTLNHDYRQKKV